MSAQNELQKRAYAVFLVAESVLGVDPRRLDGEVNTAGEGHIEVPAPRDPDWVAAELTGLEQPVRKEVDGEMYAVQFGDVLVDEPRSTVFGEYSVVVGVEVSQVE